MRKLILFLHASLDSFVEGPNGAMDIGWIAYDADLANHANKILNSADTVIWGRATYKMMHNYWPTMLSNPEASGMNEIMQNGLKRQRKSFFNHIRYS